MKVNRGGFTILESMIFLTVSAVMFVGVATMFRDTQGSTQFSQSVREFETSLNGILNDANTGVFPDIENKSCAYDAFRKPSFSNNVGQQTGDGNGCVLLGKAIQIGTDTSDDRYYVHTLIGDNRNASSDLNYLADQAGFNALAVSTLADSSFDSVEELSLKWGTKIKYTYYKQSPSPQVFVWAIGAVYTNFGGSSSSSRFTNGQSRITLAAITPNDASANIKTNALVSVADFENSIRSLATSDYDENFGDVISVCLVGGNGEQAVIDVGTSEGGLSAVAKFETRPECNV
ncbi:hypothetical protein KC878_00355 [Candidatus Saccharibacteria bacterium]|nr:hypothetical protein [Candidatus Saccharibacteria bacterium]MCB9821237.1 hypothetical protein [Candidatus Nomurabacteria bacterium]